MPRAPTSSQMSARPSPLQRFCCPHCQRLFKRKSGWTQHIQSMHSELGITYAQSQSTVISVPIFDYTQVLPPTADHHVAETALIEDLAARARERMDGKGDNPMRTLLVHQ